MGSSGVNDVNSWVLSKVLDNEFVGTKEEVDLYRLVTYLDDSMCHPLCITVGSSGDGFTAIQSDIDRMVQHPEVVVMDTDMYQLRLVGNKCKDVLLLREEGCRPGYTTLQVGGVRHVKYCKRSFMKSVVHFMNLRFLSSDIFREQVLELLNYLGYESVSSGPSIKRVLGKRSSDLVIGFKCVTWPKHAEEWISRTRLFGWPTNAMISTIVHNGCHIVPIGDKCSENTLLKWRISFATAERFLVHSFNHTQFKVYGLLKYLLYQIKFKLKQKTGDDDIICSYFMKTIMLFAVENTPHSFWKEGNLFLCFRFCFSMLLDWVASGYCPNYFIKANNMFERKIHGENKLKVLNILCELHQMRWMSLSAETGFLPSLWNLMRNTTRDELLCVKTPLWMECKRDFLLNGGLYGVGLDVKVTQLMKKLLNSSTDINELVVYFRIVRFLADFSSNTLQQESNKSVGNKARYTSLRKCKHLLAASFGTNILYLASFHYLTGNYQKALEMSRYVRWSVILDLRNKESLVKYTAVYCGKGYSTLYKMKQAYSADIIFTEGGPQRCVPQLDLEVWKKRPFPLSIPPKEYALFPLFLCYDTLGDKRGCHETLCDLVHYKNCSEGKHNYWIVHTMIGICYQIQRDYCHAIMEYHHSLILNPKHNPAQERIKALEPFLHT